MIAKPYRPFFWKFIIWKPLITIFFVGVFWSWILQRDLTSEPLQEDFTSEEMLFLTVGVYVLELFIALFAAWLVSRFQWQNRMKNIILIAAISLSWSLLFLGVIFILGEKGMLDDINHHSLWYYMALVLLFDSVVALPSVAVSAVCTAFWLPKNDVQAA